MRSRSTHEQSAEPSCWSGNRVCASGCISEPLAGHRSALAFDKLQMRHLSPKQHRLRAILFLGGGGVLAFVPAIGMYHDTGRKMVGLWILSLLATLPAVAWGASHLAQSRGYSGSAGCGLCIVGYVVSGFLGTTSPHPLALGVGMLFILLLPTVVLFAMPNKAEHSHRSRYR